MKNFSIIILLLLTAAAVYASTWDTAVEIYADFDHLEPHRMSITSQTFDRKGQLEKTEETEYLLDYSLDKDNPEREIIRAIEDGVDVTDEKREENRKNRGRGGPPGDMEEMNKMPLDPAVQEDVTAVYTGRKEYKNSIFCEIWDVDVRLSDKYSGVGTIWLDTETGAAVRIEYYIEPLFPFVEEMDMSMDFRADDMDRWVLSKMGMNGRVNMLVMKKGFKTEIKFSDYR